MLSGRVYTYKRIRCDPGESSVAANGTLRRSLQPYKTTLKVKYELRNGRPVLARLPEINFIDDKAGKPVGIHYYIGRRPIAAFGNSDGDFQMLEWTTTGSGPRIGMIVHHDDAKREWAYDRKSSIGKLNGGLDEALKRGWLVVSMQRDWRFIFPFERY